MTIMEALHRVDSLKPNSYSNPEKIQWLSILDGIIKKDIIDTHEGGEDVEFEGYEEDVELTKNLLVPAPYDEIYIHWLEAQMDYTNGEYGKYNNSMVTYNNSYLMYEKYYNRMHKALVPVKFNF
jgi:hypothetical protein